MTTTCTRVYLGVLTKLPNRNTALLRLQGYALKRQKKISSGRQVGNFFFTHYRKKYQNIKEPHRTTTIELYRWHVESLNLTYYVGNLCGQYQPHLQMSFRHWKISFIIIIIRHLCNTAFVSICWIAEHSHWIFHWMLDFLR